MEKKAPTPKSSIRLSGLYQDFYSTNSSDEAQGDKSLIQLKTSGLRVKNFRTNTN